MVELICIDVDGTLVGTDNAVRADVWDGLEALRSEGVKLAVCTGRPAFGAARSFAERAMPDGWHVFQNGASVVNVGTGESLSSEFPADEEAQLLRAAEQSGLLLERYTDSAYGTTALNTRAIQHAELLGVETPLLMAEFKARPTVRMQWLVSYADAERARALTPVGVDMHPAGSPCMTDTLFISLTAPQVSKGSAIKRIAEAYGISLERTMMIGDGENDLQALATVGHSVAMGNAELVVKQAAQHTVGHVDEGGLLEALALARRL